jgi:hypothetical protein
MRWIERGSGKVKLLGATHAHVTFSRGTRDHLVSGISNVLRTHRTISFNSVHRITSRVDHRHLAQEIPIPHL